MNNEFMNLVKSIEKYGGFYIGRYETGDLSKNTLVVRRMNTDIDHLNWYSMYQKMKSISRNPNVQTNMIWGCLWDETMQWLIQSGAKTQSQIAVDSDFGNYYNTSFLYKNSMGEIVTKNKWKNIQIPTGSSEYCKTNNIYDLAGNMSEFVSAGFSSDGKGYSTDGRFYVRGGEYEYVSSTQRPATLWGASWANEASRLTGGRAILWIK